MPVAVAIGREGDDYLEGRFVTTDVIGDSDDV